MDDVIIFFQNQAFHKHKAQMVEALMNVLQHKDFYAHSNVFSTPLHIPNVCSIFAHLHGRCFVAGVLHSRSKHSYVAKDVCQSRHQVLCGQYHTVCLFDKCVHDFTSFEASTQTMLPQKLALRMSREKMQPELCALDAYLSLLAMKLQIGPSVYSMWVEDSKCYYLMECGETALNTHLQICEDIVGLSTQSIDFLEKIATAGFILFDLKLCNLMLRSDGNLFAIDFDPRLTMYYRHSCAKSIIFCINCILLLAHTRCWYSKIYGCKVNEFVESHIYRLKKHMDVWEQMADTSLEKNFITKIMSDAVFMGDVRKRKHISTHCDIMLECKAKSLRLEFFKIADRYIFHNDVNTYCTSDFVNVLGFLRLERTFGCELEQKMQALLPSLSKEWHIRAANDQSLLFKNLYLEDISLCKQPPYFQTRIDELHWYIQFKMDQYKTSNNVEARNRIVCELYNTLLKDSNIWFLKSEHAIKATLLNTLESLNIPDLQSWKESCKVVMRNA